MIKDLMARELALPLSYINRVAARASHSYKTYTIAKRDGGDREIHHPARPLKALQRWLAQKVISRWPVHACAMAYRKGVSIADNANVHRRFAYSIRIDLQSFFPSIDAQDVNAFIKVVEPGWDSDDCDLFCRLVCRHDVLTIGAPTSPALSNAMCHDLDVQLAKLLDGGAYTRYADDLVFSTNRRDVLCNVEAQVSEVLKVLACPRGLLVNKGKTLHLGRKRRRLVTGVVVGSDSNVHVGRQRKREIRALVHQFDRLDSAAQMRLAGLIAHAVSIDKDLVNDLVLKYGAAAIKRVMRSSAGGGNAV